MAKRSRKKTTQKKSNGNWSIGVLAALLIGGFAATKYTGNNTLTETVSEITKQVSKSVQKESSNTSPSSSTSSNKNNTPTSVETSAATEEGKRRVKDMLELPAYCADRPEQVVFHQAYTVSYNAKHHVPNWVAWKLTYNRTQGKNDRSRFFNPDPELKAGTSPEDSDYKGSGYDRGHMCPAGDNRFSFKAMEESFYLSNICPQTHQLNAGDWKELEEKCRKWTKTYGTLYIACGPILPKRATSTIGAHKVTVPSKFYKVVMRTDKGGTKAIGFVYSQTDKGHPIAYYAVCVDKVEELTGIDFFHNLPDKDEKKAEAECNPSDWF